MSTDKNLEIKNRARNYSFSGCALKKRNHVVDNFII